MIIIFVPMQNLANMGIHLCCSYLLLICGSNEVAWAKDLMLSFFVVEQI